MRCFTDIISLVFTPTQTNPAGEGVVPCDLWANLRRAQEPRVILAFPPLNYTKLVTKFKFKSVSFLL